MMVIIFLKHMLNMKTTIGYSTNMNRHLTEEIQITDNKTFGLL